MTESLQTRLRMLRHQVGLTAAEMAHRVGLKDRKSWENYERGHSMPKADALSRLALMGVDINWLLTGLHRESTEGTDPLCPVPVAVPAPAPSPAPLNTALLAQIGEEITLLLHAEQQEATPARVATLQAQAYADLVATYDTEQEQSLGLRLILQQIRKSLHKPAPSP